MSELISGKEALIALASGEEVEWTHFSVGKWHNVPQGTAKLQYFLDGDSGWKFRLKPRTILINGIEVPAPFEPKVGETYWCLSTQTVLGYGHNVYESERADRRFINMGAWRTEDEIEQVVAALRSVFNKN